jgi:hypothetical protein
MSNIGARVTRERRGETALPRTTIRFVSPSIGEEVKQKMW